MDIVTNRPKADEGPAWRMPTTDEEWGLETEYRQHLRAINAETRPSDPVPPQPLRPEVTT